MNVARHITPYRQSVLVGLCITVLLFLLQFGSTGLAYKILQRAEGIVYDLRLTSSLTPRESGFAEIIIVDLDELTMDEIGWPWPRALLGTMVNKLADAGAVVVAFDVLFAEPERNPAEEVIQFMEESALLQSSSQPIQPSSHPAQAPAKSAPSAGSLHWLINELDGDQRFMESYDSTDVVLGYILQGDNVKRGQLPAQAIDSNATPDETLLVGSYSGFVTSLPEFHNASAGEGFINSSPDPDGFLRKSALLYRYQNKLFPSLSLEAARLYTLADTVSLKTQAAGTLTAVEGVMIGSELIPTDAQGRVLIPYRGEQRSFPYISAYDILNDSVKPQAYNKLEGAIVLVGTSAIGLADLRATPMGVQYPGVEVHANVLEGLLQPQILKFRPDWSDALVAIYLVTIGTLLSWLMPKLGPMRMATTGGIMIALTITSNVLLWQHANMELPLVTAVVLIIAITMYNIATGFFQESRQRQQIKSIFNQYVPPAHIDKMLSAPDSVNMEGERKELTVLFSDIRSFTSISEQLTANQLKALLNRYFDPITENIFNHQGTIDKYVGDMVMAFWGAPLDDEKHAEHAVTTALEMLQISAKLSEEFEKDGLPGIAIGIGVNTGDMNVGDMGSTFRRAYTVLGDAVNLGSRLEGLTKFYGVNCLVSDTTKGQCSDKFVFRTIDRVKVKGKQTAVTIHQPFLAELLNDTFHENLTRYHQALAYYLQQNWQPARELFNQLQANDPQTLYALYLERIDDLSQQTLPVDWDGSFTHITK